MSSHLLRQPARCIITASKRCCSSQSGRLSNAEARKKRNVVYEAEKARQSSLVTRVEKIQVEHKGVPEDCTLLMNKNLSTPFNCAMHIGEVLVQRSVLALVNGEPWDMHRPLVEDCEIRFLHFKEHEPALVNQTFWRSCSFMLGHVLESAFKDSYYVQLCSFPKPNVRSGSFVYDADLSLSDWSPSEAELNCLSRIGARLGQDDIRFERLDVDASIAQKMFADNKFKLAQIPAIAANSHSGSLVTVYRMADHIDITRGPLMASTAHLLRFNVTAVHDIESPDFGHLKRIQGLATPKQLPIHYWTYEKLSTRGAKLNPAPVPALKVDMPKPVVECQPV